MIFVNGYSGFFELREQALGGNGISQEQVGRTRIIYEMSHGIRSGLFSAFGNCFLVVIRIFYDIGAFGTEQVLFPLA